LEAADCVYASMDEELVRVALEEAPAFLVGRNKTHAEKLLELLRARLGKAGESVGDFEAGSERSSTGHGALSVCVVPLSKHRGYNFGRHYRRLVLPPLPSSVATRVQLFGRLTRMDQEHSDVHYVTVVPRRTILEVLHDRHASDDAVQASIEKLGQRFGHLAEAMLLQEELPAAATASSSSSAKKLARPRSSTEEAWPLPAGKRVRRTSKS